MKESSQGERAEVTAQGNLDLSWLQEGAVREGLLIRSPLGHPDIILIGQGWWPNSSGGYKLSDQ